MISQDEFKPKKNLKIENWQKWGFHMRSGILAYSILVQFTYAKNPENSEFALIWKMKKMHFLDNIWTRIEKALGLK